MFSAEIDTKRLNEGMRMLAKETKKGIDEVIEKQASMIVGNLIGITPPASINQRTMSKSGGINSQAKRDGEAKVKSEIAKLFPTSRVKEDKLKGMIEGGHRFKTHSYPRKITKYAGSVAELKRLHQSARSPSTGRVRVGQSGQRMAITRTALRREYMKQQAKKVGMLNAGWLRAARKLKTAKSKTPAWITRHGQKPGSVHFRKSIWGLSITVANNMPYFPRGMQSKIDSAVRRRAHGIERQLEAMMERKARKAEKRMGN